MGAPSRTEVASMGRVTGTGVVGIIALAWMRYPTATYPVKSRHPLRRAG
jgi:hypothetical protein